MKGPEHIDSIEASASGIELSGEYKDLYGQIVERIKSTRLDCLPDTDIHKGLYFDGSVRTPHGDFIFDCLVSEAKKILRSISDLIATKERLITLEEELKQESWKLNKSYETYRNTGTDPDSIAYNLVEKLFYEKTQLKGILRVNEDYLKNYKV